MAIENNIKNEKLQLQNDIKREATKISSLSSVNIDKY